MFPTTKFRIVAAAALLASLTAVSTGAMAGEGMPQLDFANPLTVAQVVWGAIIFFVLYLLLSRWALPQVSSVLEMREGRINADLDTARAAKVRADSAIAELTVATQRARAEAQAAINTAIDLAKQAAAAQSAELNAKLEAQIAGAEERIGQARASALGALRQVATETAHTVIGRLTGVAPDTARIDATVGALLAARGQG
jgi:F-type H+-transporting ATPase subunit b